MITLNELVFGYEPGHPILSIPSLKIQRGEKVFLYGPSGSGKSTLLNLMAGVLTPNDGNISVLGRDLAASSQSEKDHFRGDHIGFIFQQFNLIPYLSVIENILLPLEFSKTKRTRAGKTPENAAQEKLNALGFPKNLIERKVTEISVGQQQRVAAARALMGDPELLIADEPTSSLDEENKAAFLRLLIGECDKNETTLVFVSHDKGLERHFDRSMNLYEINRAAL